MLVARRESFGGIVGDTSGYGFSVVNRVAFDMLKRLTHSHTEFDLTDSSKREFLASITCRGWCDRKSGRFNGRILDNGNHVPFLSAPIRVWLEVTSRCNLSCPQCFNQNHPDHLTPDLPLPYLAAIIEELKEAAVPQVTVTGGEPLVRKDIFLILDLLARREFGIRFFTNGTSIIERNAKRLAEFPISHLFFSLDGVGEINDVLRGQGTFPRIIKGLDILSRKIPEITLSTTLHRFSVEGIHELFAIAQDHGVRSLLIRPLLQYVDHGNPLTIPASQLQELLDVLEEASNRYQVEYQLNKLPFRPLNKTVFVHDNPEDVHFSYFNKYNQFGCVGGNTVVGIKANGVIMACGFVPHQYDTVGHSVFEKSFLELWNTSENVTVLRDLPGNPTCRECALLSVCGGGCRANALLHAGDLNAVDPYCYWREGGVPEGIEPTVTEMRADDRKPFVSDRAIITKCGSGTHL